MEQSGTEGPEQKGPSLCSLELLLTEAQCRWLDLQTDNVNS